MVAVFAPARPICCTVFMPDSPNMPFIVSDHRRWEWLNGAGCHVPVRVPRVVAGPNVPPDSGRRTQRRLKPLVGRHAVGLCAARSMREVPLIG